MRLSFAKTPQARESRVCNNVTDLSHAIHFKRIHNFGEGQGSQDSLRFTIADHACRFAKSRWLL